MKYIAYLGFALIVTLSCKQNNETNANTPVSPFSDITPEQAAKLLENNTSKYTILDVRTPEEISEGKITNATELDFKSETFEADLQKLDKNKSYLVYCRSGGRSGKTTKLMQQNGFKSAYNIDGGFEKFNKALNE